MEVTTITQRCLSDQPRIQRYEPSITRVTKPDLLLLWPPFSSTKNREQSIGVSVNETNMLIKIEKPTTNPKLLKKRPTCPCMKATGTKMTSSDMVVATTAVAISEVAGLEASIAERPNSS